MNISTILERAKAMLDEQFPYGARVVLVVGLLDRVFGNVADHDGDRVVWVDDEGAVHFSARDALWRIT